jgi:hypothetical protein
MSHAPNTADSSDVSPLAVHARRAAITTGALALGLAALYPVWSNDLFGHMAAGRQILDLGRVPDHDTFSFYFDQPRPWRNHNWASCVLFYALYAAFGPDALVCLKVLLCGALGAIVVATGTGRASSAPMAALALLWSVPSVRPRFTERPHLFGLLFCALLLSALTWLARADAKRRVWPAFALLAAMQVCWVNLHGSAPMAFLLTGAFVLGHHGDPPRQRRYLALLLVQVLASCVTPFGPFLMGETFYHVGSEGTRFFIAEWAPLHDSDNPWDVPACTAVLLLTLATAVPLWRSGSAGRSWLIVTLGLLVMAYRSLRFVAEPLILGAPCVAMGLALRFEQVNARGRRLVAVAGLALAVAALGVIARVAPRLPPFQPMAFGLSPRNVPMQPGRWLAAHRPRARIVGLFEDCWYLSFAVPRSRVIADGRQAVYPLDVLTSLDRALHSPPQLLKLVERKRADAVVLRHTRVEHASAIEALRRHPDFRVATVGDRHVLFVRGLADDQAVTALEPNLDLRALDAGRAARGERELRRIGAGPGAAQYAGFQRALLTLSPDLRGGGRDGLPPATDAARRERYRRALVDLAPALAPYENQTSAHALAAMAHLALCRTEEAARALSLARAEGENRYTIALAIELALRRGRRDEARRMLEELRPEGPDAWLAALRDELSGTVPAPCGGSR